MPVSTVADDEVDAERPAGVAVLGSTVDDAPLPRMRKRLTPTHHRSDPVWGWLAPIIITLVSGILNFWNITTPHDLTFDETYYAKDAYSLLVKHYAANYISDGDDTNGNEADIKINAGSTDGIFSDGVNEVVHPEVGKWMIALGEGVFGLNPLGWRSSAAVTGALMVLVLCRLVRRLTGSTMLGCVAGVLLTLDGLHFVMSRIALLDIFLAFWLLCGVHCLVADRDWARARLAATSELSPHRGRWDFGPVRGLILRPWRIAAGVCFGLACGTKWSAVFVVGAFGLLIWAWDSGMRRAIGVRWAPLKSLVADAIPSFFTIIVVGFVVYVCSWMAFLTHVDKFENAFGHAYDKNDWNWSSLNDDRDGPINGVLHDLDALWNYHKELWNFHTGDYLAHQYHPWQSHPGGWLVLNRPIVFALTQGDQIPNCPPEDGECIREIIALGNPVIWWVGVGTLVIGAGYWLTRRDWRFGVAIVGVLATWLPWFRWDNRQIFFYYGVSIVPFTIIAITLVIGKMLGTTESGYSRRVVAAITTSAILVASAVAFAYFYPVLSDRLISKDAWADRVWLVYWNKSVPSPFTTTSSN